MKLIVETNITHCQRVSIGNLGGRFDGHLLPPCDVPVMYIADTGKPKQEWGGNIRESRDDKSTRSSIELHA
jgi:hypothetical protein